MPAHKRHFLYDVELTSGINITAKVKGEDIDAFIEWMKTLPGVKQYQEASSTNKISPFTRKNTKIARLRIAAGMTQQEFADMLSVTRQTVSRWEAGTVFPDIEKIADIVASVLEQKIDEGVGQSCCSGCFGCCITTLGFAKDIALAIIPYIPAILQITLAIITAVA